MYDVRYRRFFRSTAASGAQRPEATHLADSRSQTADSYPRTLLHAWLRHEGNALLFGAAVCYSLLYLFFWPPMYTTMDESSYLNMAYVLRQGTVYPDVAGVPTLNAFPVDGHMVVKYPLGMPALLAL